jgi:exodeoxyribonuclease VII small subunit
MAEKSKKESINFEKALKRLEKIVDSLENTNPPLNKALALYQEGKKLSHVCNTELTSLEQKIMKIMDREEEGVMDLEDFAPLDNS